jgi:hypothetical protein
MSPSLHRIIVVLAIAVSAFVLVPVAAADGWLPHPADATWTYEWTDSVYNPTPTKEKVTVKEQKGSQFTLAWTTQEQGNDPAAPVSLGLMAFQESASGLVNTDWSSNLPPPSFPILCGSPTRCNNSIASTYYQLIWGTRAPVLPAPLLTDTQWTSTGGAQGDVSSASDYVGTERVTVPAFPGPVLAAKVRSEVTQAGAIGDPYGSGVRTVWWVYGVGPVKIVFAHSGSGSPITTSVLTSTNQTPEPPPPDTRWFPLTKGQTSTFRWTNSKHMKKPSVQQFTTDEVANGSARISVKHLSGPIRVVGAYGFTLRGDGITNLWATTKSATISPLPRLGPSALPANRRRNFVTPYDLMVFGFNPVIPAYPLAGDRWAAAVPGRDFSLFGVTGTTTVVGIRTVKVPAGTFKALVVRSKLKQKGFPFGSGTRTIWLEPKKGLVKLVFDHGDGSISTVDRLR